MKIGIDISQLAYANTGVANYLSNLLENLFKIDTENEYVLFFSSLRGKLSADFSKYENVQVKKFSLPPILLDLLWNKLHIMPIEGFIGSVDVFLTSDWTEPPAKAQKATILYDLIVYKYPEESHNKSEFNLFKFIISPNIVASQKRKLSWVKKESQKIMCISEATKKDAQDLLGVSQDRLSVIYPGFTL